MRNSHNPLQSFTVRSLLDTPQETDCGWTEQYTPIANGVLCISPQQLPLCSRLRTLSRIWDPGLGQQSAPKADRRDLFAIDLFGHQVFGHGRHRGCCHSFCGNKNDDPAVFFGSQSFPSVARLAELKANVEALSIANRQVVVDA